MSVTESSEVAIRRSIPIARDGHRGAGRNAAGSNIPGTPCDVCALQILRVAQKGTVSLIEFVIDAKGELWLNIERRGILSEIACDQWIGSRSWLRHKLVVECGNGRHLCSWDRIAWERCSAIRIGLPSGGAIGRVGCG